MLPWDPSWQTLPILVVEDDDGIREVIGDLLEEEGYSVWTARNGMEALDLLRARRTFGLVLLDLNMPWFNGWQLLEALKRHHEVLVPPLIVMTGNGDSAPPGADEVIQKPFSFPDLLERIRRLHRREPRRNLGSPSELEGPTTG
jgi:DNA-binding response OmpR family regulator